MENKKIVGRKEIISILDLDLVDLDAKIDTGLIQCASLWWYWDYRRSCSFYSSWWDSFSISWKRISLPLYKLKKVKSSNGEIQLRPSIKVTVLFMGKKYKSVISLTSRADMKFPMLIGRRFLKDKFLVDCLKRIFK